jgi:enoyl-[acyl-carrier protein] reductase/trans-2-enoyl-CoA reductase (NAD+)
VNGDAFAPDVKDAVLERVAADLGPVDLVVYSLAAPRRLHPVTGQVHRSVIKPIGRAFSDKSVDADRGAVERMTLEPASPEEIADTVAVMGGEDWGLWVDRLADAGLLAAGAITCAYSYLGPELTWPIYRDGTIGRAKQDLEAQAARLDERLRALDGRAFVSVNKAVVTQASAAIPVVSLYLALLFAVMKEKGLHEDCVQQICRLFGERLYGRGPVPVDDCGRIRLDELELRADVQEEVMRRWRRIESDNVGQVVNLDEYRGAFLRLFGFGYPDIDYAADADCLCGWAL